MTPHSQHFSCFADISAHLEKRGFFRIQPGLQRITAAITALGLQNLGYTSIQVLGTNGKGSTSTYLAALIQAHGHSVGLFTSPHFVSLRERVRINGQMLPEEDWVGLANEVTAAAPDLTYFEFTTALAALAFSRAGLRFAIIEAGLGGSWDATTALPAQLTLFTPISLDHCALLGETVAAVAFDKAEAIRPGTPVISAAQTDDAFQVLQSTALSRNAPFVVAQGFEGLPPAFQEDACTLGMAGGHQHGNAGLALAAWRHLAAQAGLAESDAAVRHALCTAFIPGRMQYINSNERDTRLPAMILDGAHNAHGMAALSKALAYKQIAPAAVIFSCLEDKEPDHIAPHLRVLATGPVFIPPLQDNPRAVSPATLARFIGLNARPTASLGEALTLAQEHRTKRLGQQVAERPGAHPVLLCGSLYLLGDFFSLYPEYLNP